MKYHIIATGKIKEAYLTAGIQEFLKRLRPYGQVELTVLPEEKMPDHPSPAQKEQVLEKEGEKMLSHVHPGSHLWQENLFPRKSYHSAFPTWPSMVPVN